MGEYGAFIWPSYILTLAVMLAMVAVSWRTLRKAQSQLFQLQQLAESDEA